MAFVIEELRQFPAGDTYEGQHSIFELEFRLFAPVAVVIAAIDTALFAADFVLQDALLSYTLERDQNFNPDHFRFLLFFKGEISQTFQGTDVKDIANVPGSHIPGRYAPGAVQLAVIAALGSIAVQLAIAFGILALFAVIVWKIFRGGLWGLLGGDNPSGTDILMLAAIITLGVGGVILLKNSGKQRSLQRG